MVDIVLVLLALAALLLVVSVVEPLAKRFSLPSSLVLALLGMLLGLLVYMWQGMPDHGFAGDLAHGLENLGLSASAFLYLFLPPLLFTAGLNVDLRLLRDEAAAVLLLAVVAVVVCAAFVGLFLSPLSEVGLIACLLLGSVVATTDPAAVIGAFRDIGAPRRLTTLVSGESLLNDAAAIVLFTIFLGIVKIGGEVAPDEAAVEFLIVFCGGLAFGFALGKLAGPLFAYLRSSAAAATTVSVAVAYLAFIAGERYFHVSGVVAVVTASLVINLEGPTRLTPMAWESLHEAWEQLEFWANSLIFVLASMLAVRVLPAATWDDIVLVVVLIAAALSSRALVLYLLLPLLTRLKLAAPVAGTFKAVILWGGLRGAVTLTLALSVAGDPAVSPEIRHFIAVLSTAYVLFTLFVQAPTLQPLLRILGLDRLPPLERMLRDRVMALSREEVRRQVAETADNYGFSGSLTEQVLPPKLATEDAGAGNMPLDAGLLTLVAFEKTLYMDHFREQTLSRRLAAQLAAGADRILDAVHDRGLLGYNEATQRVLRFSRQQRRALWIQRRFGWSQPLARALAERFETLVIVQLVVGELIQYNEGALRSIMGEEIAAELKVALQQRLAQVEAALAAVETRYPSYTEALRRQYLARVALRLEDTSYTEHLEEALISREVFADLQRDLKRRWELVNRRPPLDLGLDLAHLIAQVPLFQDLPAERQAELATLLRPDLAIPGERVITRGTRGTRMYFLVSGEVHVQLKAGDIVLGAGDFFGEMALLSNEPRNADVTAFGFCHLLVLDARDFQRVIRSDPALRAKIEQVAADRANARKPAVPGLQGKT